MSHTSQEQKNISVEFMNSLSKLMDKIDDLTEKINDGEYLDLMNMMKELHTYKDNFKQTVVYKTHQRRSVALVRAPPRLLTRQEKLNQPDIYKLCDRCDTIVTKGRFTDHQNTQKCINTLQKKQLSSSSRTTVLNQDILIKLEKKDYDFLRAIHESKKDDDDEKKDD